MDSLHAGMIIRIGGSVLTIRDRSLLRLFDDMEKGEMPLSVSGRLLFFAAPTPGFVNGTASIGPTTSWRMGTFVPRLLQLGAVGFIGKGYFPEGVPEVIRRHKAIYFQALGGAGAYYGMRMSEPKPLLYEDFGPEAVFEIKITDFPVVVSIDSRGAVFT